MNIINRIVAAYNNHREFARTVNELRGLTDKELDDIGISRVDIRRIARQSV